VRAGAEVLTNSLARTPSRHKHGLEERTEEINRRAVEIARKAAGETALWGQAYPHEPGFRARPGVRTRRPALRRRRRPPAATSGARRDPACRECARLPIIGR
jgi:hypothetical protein